MDIETPKEKKPRVLKRIKKKKPDLNISSTKKKKVFSYGRSNISLSTSIQKQSLRANNKALAFNLERSREALRFANDANLELQRNNQELHMKLTTLERVAGLKDNEIESEVSARLKKHMSDLKTKMVGMRRLFYDAFACMDEVTDMCNLLSHRSSHGQRDTSLGSSICDTSMPHGTFEGHCRSLFSQIPKTGFPSMLPGQDDMSTGPGTTPSLAVTHDMSMIAETSVLLEDITPPSNLVDQITDIEEAENENVEPKKISVDTSVNSEKMAPQRVLKLKHKNSTIKVQPASAEKANIQVGSPVVTNKRLDRRGTFVINSNVSDKSQSESMFSKKDDLELEKGALKPAKNSSQSSEEQSKKESIGGSDSRLSSPKSKSPVIDTKEGSMSPKLAAKTRSRSKGRLHQSELTVAECTDSPDVNDRRKTFVLPRAEPGKEANQASSSKSSECLSNYKTRETADERRKTYLLLPTDSKSAPNQSLSPVPLGNDDVTQCFSMDMEMTEVIDSTQLIQLVISEQNQQKEIPTTENSQLESGNRVPGPKQGTEGISLLPNSSDSSDSELPNKPALVEFRIPRPGKIVFSASRKEMDGSRKPIPSKLPLKARSKSKIKLSRSKGRKDIVPESPKGLKSIFDFHDRTPKGKKDDLTKTTGSVYDLSMNESLRDLSNKPSLSQFRQNCEQELKGKTSAGSKETDIKLLPDNPVYYQPLKECSPEPPVQKRSRSKSRTRKGDTDDNDKSGSYSSRARSRSRRRNEEESTEKAVNESRGRSRSKRRQNPTEEVASPDLGKCKDSGSSGIENETETCRSRGRSRSKRRRDIVEADSDVEESGAEERSRSRNRKKDGDYDEDKEKAGLKIRTRSRSRRRKEQEEETVLVREEVIKEVDSTSKSNLPESDSDIEGHRSRSRSIKRKKNIDVESNFVTEKGSMKTRTPSQSRHRKDLVESDDVSLENSNLAAEAESRQNLNTFQTEIEKENEDHVSRATSLERGDKAHRKSEGRQSELEDEESSSTNIVSRKSRGRSHSRRKIVDSDSETDVSASATKSNSEHCTNVEETPDKMIRKRMSRGADLSENKRKATFKQGQSRARSRTRRTKETTGQDENDSKHGTGSAQKPLEEKLEVVILDSDEDKDLVKPLKNSENPAYEEEAVAAGSFNLIKSCGEDYKDNEVDIGESVIVLSSPPEPIKAKKKLSLHKKNSRKSSSSSDTNEKSNTGETKEEIESVEENNISSEKKQKVVDEDGDKIPRLAEGLFVTKRGRSLKPIKLDDQDLVFDFENISNNFNVDTNNTKLPKTPSTPAVGRTKASPKDKTGNSKLKKLKSSKKSTNKRRRSNCSSLSEAEQQTPQTRTSAETGSSTNKENDRPALGLSEQLQNIRRKLVSLDKRQSKLSLESQSVPDTFDFSKLDMGNSEPENKRQRRGTAQVSYKEMSLTTKMRREDFEVPKTSRKPRSNVTTPIK